MNKSLDLKIEELKFQLEDHKKQRCESENMLFENLKLLVESLKGQIEKEKTEREQTEETIMGLLENTCDKLQNSI